MLIKVVRSNGIVSLFWQYVVNSDVFDFEHKYTSIVCMMHRYMYDV